MTLDAGKSLRSVITEKEQRHVLMFVRDYKYPPTRHLLYITSESLIRQIFLLPLFNEIYKNKWNIIKLFGKEFWTQGVWLRSLYYMTEHPKSIKLRKVLTDLWELLPRQGSYRQPTCRSRDQYFTSRARNSKMSRLLMDSFYHQKH